MISDAQRQKLHILAGLALSILAGLFVCPIIVWLPWGWLKVFVMMGAGGFGLFMAALAGALKEIVWDWLLKKGTPEFLDFVATAAGGIIGYLLLQLI